jgi:hypothetical protein
VFTAFCGQAPSAARARSLAANMARTLPSLQRRR